MSVVIIDYGAGNVRSVQCALERLGVAAVLTSDIDLIQQAHQVIFPGVGEAGTAMKALRSKGLDTVIPQLKQPVLGICLGMQLLCDYSEEGDTKCLGLFPEQVKRFAMQQKVPHMGWNNMEALKGPLFQGVVDEAYAYFVHSYYVPVSDFTMATCLYQQPFSAAIAKGNFYGCQFHPEKSAEAGAIILRNFLNL